MKTTETTNNSTMSADDLMCVARKAIRLLRDGLRNTDLKRKKECLNHAYDLIHDSRFEWTDEIYTQFLEYDRLFDDLVEQVQTME